MYTHKDNISQQLQAIYEDIQMLKSGSWEPDDDSCEATLDNIRQIGAALEIPLTNIIGE